MDLVKILKLAVDQGASDVHLTIGTPPLARIHGEIKEMPEFEALTPESSKNVIYSILRDFQKASFEENYELDCAISVPSVGRFRVNIQENSRGVEAVLRAIPTVIPTPESLGLVQAMTDLADLPRGLVLVTGPTGSGKSTTLACMIERINQHFAKHILTIEDPIEFVYTRKKSIIRQREVGPHTKSFQEALRRALRQDPDVILVGELRDLETISLALTAAETGHLCFATLHTQDTAQTVDRIIDVFPANQQQQVRIQLASTLKGVVAQILLPRRDGKGRVAAREVLLSTPAVANLIREGKTHMLPNAIETSGKLGMIAMDRSLEELVRKGLVDAEEARSKAHNPKSIPDNSKGTVIG